MFKYKNIVFSLRGILVNSLNMIKGIGISRARYIMDSLGFSRFFKTVYMNHYHHGNLVVLLKSCYLLDVRLQELHIQRLEFFYSYSFIKGFRLFDGLSLKGRTHSNGSTAYRLKPFSEKYNEQILSKQRRYLLYAKTRVKKKKKIIMLNFYRFLFISLVGVFCLQISYCDNEKVVDIYNVYFLEKILDQSSAFSTLYDCDYSCKCNEIYQDISTCNLQNHVVYKQVSYLRRVLNCCVFILSCSWNCCGLIGFFWMLWVINRIYTGGAVDHD